MTAANGEEGIIMFYADNIRSAKNKMAAAISTLGHGLASLSKKHMRLNQVQLRTVSEQTSLLQLDTPGSLTLISSHQQ
ncbi:hypothetical protein WJX77_010110 [Trebouxia sp. C0004]